MTAQEIIGELQGVQSLLEERQSAPVPGISNAIASSIAKKINRLPGLDVSDALAIQDAVGAVPFDSQSASILQGAVASKLVAANADDSQEAAGAADNRQQVLLHPGTFMPQSTVEVLTSPDTSPPEAYYAMMCVYKKLGIDSLTAQSKKWCVALQVAFEQRRTAGKPIGLYLSSQAIGCSRGWVGGVN